MSSRLFLHGSTRLPGLAPAIRYLIAAVPSASIAVAIPIIMVEFGGVEASPAAAIGFFAALVVNFLTLKFYVYRALGNWHEQALRFLAAAGLFRLSEYGIFLVLHLVFGVFYIVAIVVALGLSFIAKFFVYSLFVFPPQLTKI